MNVEAIPWMYLALSLGLVVSLTIATSRQLGGTIRLIGLAAFLITALILVMICWGSFRLPGYRIL
jgi:hypothetical protein